MGRALASLVRYVETVAPRQDGLVSAAELRAIVDAQCPNLWALVAKGETSSPADEAIS